MISHKLSLSLIDIILHTHFNKIGLFIIIEIIIILNLIFNII